MDLQEELNDEWRHNVPGFASEQDKESEKLSAEMMEIHEDIEKRYEMMGGNWVQNLNFKWRRKNLQKSQI